MKIAVIGCSAIQRNLTKIYISLLDILYGFQGLQHPIAYAYAMNPQKKEFPFFVNEASGRYDVKTGTV